MTQAKPTYAEVYGRHNWMYAPQCTDGRMEPIHFENGLEVGPGWLPLLDDALTKIGEEVRHMPQAERQRFALVQIKKYSASCACTIAAETSGFRRSFAAPKIFRDAPRAVRRSRPAPRIRQGVALDALRVLRTAARGRTQPQRPLCDDAQNGELT